MNDSALQDKKPWKQLPNGHTSCEKYPDSKAAVVRVCTHEVKRKLGQVFIPLFFIPSCPLLASLGSSYSQLSLSLSFHQLIKINHDLYLRLIQTPCLRLNRSTPLGKSLTTHHYLFIKIFLTKPTLPNNPHPTPRSC